MSASERATEALEPIASALAADGYELSVQAKAEHVFDVRITATENACEECLSPPSVIKPILEDLLEQAGMTPSEVTLRYPTDKVTSA